MSNVQTLSALVKANQLSGKRVFIRSDLNVPFNDNREITEDTRIRASIPAVRMAAVLENEAAAPMARAKTNRAFLVEIIFLAFTIGQR